MGLLKQLSTRSDRLQHRSGIPISAASVRCCRKRVWSIMRVKCNLANWQSPRQADVKCRFQQSQTSGTVHRTDQTSERLGHRDFAWERNWYPVAILADVDGSKPIPVTLLGKKLVLWEVSEGEWSCVSDRCAHRYAPLSGVHWIFHALACSLPHASHLDTQDLLNAWIRGDAAEGRVKDGDIQCSYHGWQYNSKGQCTRIPQVLSSATAPCPQQEMNCARGLALWALKVPSKCPWWVLRLLGC